MKNSATPKVGTVIPSYNCAHTVVDTLSSLLTQHYDGEQAIVVVDDASTDATVDTLSRAFPDRIRGVFELGAEDLNGGSGEVSVIRSERRMGVAAARNAGVRFLYDLGCEVFNPLDADDVAMPNRLRDLVDAIGDPKEPIAVQGKVLTITEAGALFAYPLGGRAVWGTDPYYVQAARIWPALRRGEFPDLEQTNFLANVGMAYTRSALETTDVNQPYPPGVSWGEDWQFHITLLRNGVSLRFCDSLVALFRVRPNSLSWDQIKLDLIIRFAALHPNPYMQSMALAVLRHKCGTVESMLERFNDVKQGYLDLQQFCTHRLRESQRRAYWPNVFYYAALLHHLNDTQETRESLERARAKEIERIAKKCQNLTERSEPYHALICAIQCHTLKPSRDSAARIISLLGASEDLPAEVEHLGGSPDKAFNVFNLSVVDLT